jgi:hypothetical protein
VRRTWSIVAIKNMTPFLFLISLSAAAMINVQKIIIGKKIVIGSGGLS